MRRARPIWRARSKLARFLLDNGCDALNVLGTTGEATSFSLAERKAVMSAYKAQGLPLDRLMVGTGAAAVSDAAALTRHAADLGFAGALVLPPFYYKGVPDDGLVAYIDRLLCATEERPIPIYLYHFPAMSGLPWHVDLIKRLLATFPSRIVGLKDSSGDMAYARSAAAISPDFAVFPSTEAALLEARGGRVCRLHLGHRQLATPTFARAPGRRAIGPRSRPRSPSASCSTASRWSPASRRCSRISMAMRRLRASSRRWRRFLPPTARRSLPATTRSGPNGWPEHAFLRALTPGRGLTISLARGGAGILPPRFLAKISRLAGLAAGKRQL